MRSLLPSRSSSISPLTDRFSSLNLGNVLSLKLCGLIAEHQAEILDVEEGLLRLKVGYTRLQRWVYQHAKRLPMELRLEFREQDNADDESDAVSRSRNRYTLVDVALIPLGNDWTPERFQQESRRLLWNLRANLIAS